MSLFQVVQEQVGGMLQNTMGHVTTLVGAVRHYTTKPFMQQDTFDASGLGTGLTEPEKEIGKTSEKKLEKGIQTTRSKIRNWALIVIKWIFVLIIASFVANDMIFLPWPVRLFGFTCVLLAGQFHVALFTMLCIYYVFYILTNMYYKRPNKFPVRYAFLPLRTAKEPSGTNSDIGFFTYFLRGPESTFHKEFEALQENYEKVMLATIPNYDKLKEQLSKNKGEFETHLKDINDMGDGWKYPTVERVAEKAAEKLLEDESTTDFERVGKAASELEEASKGLSKGFFGASKAAKDAADDAAVTFELAKRKFTAQKAAERETLSKNSTSNEAKQIQKTHELEEAAEEADLEAKTTKETTKPTGSNESIRDSIRKVEQATFKARTAVEEARVARAALDAKTPTPNLGVDELRNKAADLERQADDAQKASKEAAKASAANSNLYFSKDKQNRYTTTVQTEQRYNRLQGLAEAARAKATEATSAEAAKGSEKYKELLVLNDIISKSAVDATTAKGAVDSAEATVVQAEKDIQANKNNNPRAALDARIAKREAEPKVVEAQKAAALAEQKLQKARADAARKTAEQPK